MKLFSLLRWHEKYERRSKNLIQSHVWEIINRNSLLWTEFVIQTILFKAAVRRQDIFSRENWLLPLLEFFEKLILLHVLYLLYQNK